MVKKVFMEKNKLFTGKMNPGLKKRMPGTEDSAVFVII